jgi:beta-N-acetylhexosaminidase
MSEHAPVIIDVAGLSLSGEDRRRLAHPLVGGMILFGRNWQDREQLSALCAEIKAVRPDLLISVDHEGGRVQRFRTDGFTHLPPMRLFGEMWLAEGGREGEPAMQAMSAATAAGYVLGAELRACGVDFSFTPVLDLDFGASSVIGDRSFHRDPRIVTLLARCLMQGLLQAGVANCGKHFPGHGYVRADSHLEIPEDERDLEEILSEDAIPYEWLGTTLTSVMPAHVIYSRVDPLPAGFSPRWLQDILREQLQFQGAIFSDDLSMAGARKIEGRDVTFTEAAVAALNAGCDMVLLCNESVNSPGGRSIDEMLDGLDSALERGEWAKDEMSEQRRLALLPCGPSITWDALMTEPRYMRALSQLP